MKSAEALELPKAIAVDTLAGSIVRALIYSDIFHYPLTSDEIFNRLDTECDSVNRVESELKSLVENNLVFQFDRFYSMRDDVSLALRRSSGNAMAERIMPRAIRRSRLIYSFPFVRAVMISGGLSKNYFDKNSDIDFFLITEPGKVWLTRGILALFMRVFLFNSHKYFCVNYYIDQEHLHLEERNIFTATELVTLKPVCGNDQYTRLIAANKWVEKHYPQFQEAQVRSYPSYRLLPKRIAEFLLKPFAAGLDRFVMRRLADRAVRLHGKSLSKEDFSVALKSTPYVSKNHVRNYQKKITEKFNHNVELFFREMKSV